MKKKTRYVLLGLLRDESMTGYELKSCIDRRMSFFWQESYGQLYPELSAMVKDGLLVTKEDEERGKIRYSITSQGQSEFNAWMEEEYEKDTVRSEALLRFYLADDSNKEAIIRHLTKFHEQSIEKLKLFELFMDSLKGHENDHNHRYVIHMIELGKRQQELYRDWSQEYLNDLTNID